MMDGASEAYCLAFGQGSFLRDTRVAVAFRRAVSAGITVVQCSLVALLVAASTARAAPASQLYTWPGWEPDRGATAWYWIRFVDTRAQIHVVPVGTIAAPGTFFDTPTAPFRRTQNSSTLESVLRAHPSADPGVLMLARLAHDIEINAWRPRVLPQSTTLEAAFRRLQQRWADADPPVSCILVFFDRVHVWLTQGTTLDEARLPACLPPEHQGNPE